MNNDYSVDVMPLVWLLFLSCAACSAIAWIYAPWPVALATTVMALPFLIVGVLLKLREWGILR